MKHKTQSTQPAQLPPQKHELLELVDPRNLASRQKWELDVVNMIKTAGDRTIGDIGEAVTKAKEGNWWGVIYENGTVAPFGLANYLYELYSRQIWILDIMPVMGDDYPRPQRQIDEFPSDALARFREWLKIDYYAMVKKCGLPDIELIDKRHIMQLQRVGEKRWIETQKHLVKNPNLLKIFNK